MPHEAKHVTHCLPEHTAYSTTLGMNSMAAVLLLGGPILPLLTCQTGQLVERLHNIQKVVKRLAVCLPKSASSSSPKSFLAVSLCPVAVAAGMPPSAEVAVTDDTGASSG